MDSEKCSIPQNPRNARKAPLGPVRAPAPSIGFRSMLRSLAAVVATLLDRPPVLVTVLRRRPFGVEPGGQGSQLDRYPRPLDVPRPVPAYALPAVAPIRVEIVIGVRSDPATVPRAVEDEAGPRRVLPPCPGTRFDRPNVIGRHHFAACFTYRPLPYPRRYRCADDAALTSDILRAFLRALFSALRRRSESQWDTPRGQCGSVTFIQRFGSTLGHGREELRSRRVRYWVSWETPSETRRRASDGEP